MKYCVFKSTNYKLVRIFCFLLFFRQIPNWKLGYTRNKLEKVMFSTIKEMKRIRDISGSPKYNKIICFSSYTLSKYHIISHFKNSEIHIY